MDKTHKISAKSLGRILAPIIFLIIMVSTGVVYGENTVSTKRDLKSEISSIQTTTQTVIETTTEAMAEISATEAAKVEEFKPETTTVPIVKETKPKKENTTTSKVKETTTKKPSPSKQEQAEGIFNSFPEPLKKVYKSAGWEVVVTSKMPSSSNSQDLSKVYGVTKPDLKGIYINNSGAPIKSTLQHEMGHFVDYMRGWKAEEDEEFLIAWKAEKDNLPTAKGQNASHLKSTAIEYFAAAFQVYLDDSARLKQCCPKTYSYVVEAYNDVVS